MNFFFSLLSVAGLLLVSFIASVFMIIESGSFYQALYPKGPILIPLGFIAAFLSEVFMAIMAGVRIKKQKNNQTSNHPINWLITFLLGMLFILTVGGASFNLAYSKLGEIQSQSNNKQIIQVLKSQVADHRMSLETFANQNQRVNSAITARNQEKAKNNLIQALKETKPIYSLWFEVVFVVLLRFSVQLANLTCVWLAGWIYRNVKDERNLLKSEAKAEQIRVGEVRAKAEKLRMEEEHAKAERLRLEVESLENERLEREALKAEQLRLEEETLKVEKLKQEEEKFKAKQVKLETEALKLEQLKLETEALKADQLRFEEEKNKAEQLRQEAEALKADQLRFEE
ncbi:MAG: hypothetical protein QNL04_11125, partial [SAR324 cluster bacterium]|nr:hypothetical protein [SAR324 cluster bacterium]